MKMVGKVALVTGAAFGLSTFYGLWFIRGNLLRDAAALSKVETVPLLMRLWRQLDWRSWRLAGATDEQLAVGDLALLDRLAALTRSPDEHFSELRALYDAQADLRPSRAVLVYEA